MLKTAEQIAEDALYKAAKKKEKKKRKLQDIPVDEMTEKERKKLMRRTVGKYLFLGPGIGVAHDLYRQGSGKTTGFDLIKQDLKKKNRED